MQNVLCQLEDKYEEAFDRHKNIGIDLNTLSNADYKTLLKALNKIDETIDEIDKIILEAQSLYNNLVDTLTKTLEKEIKIESIKENFGLRINLPSTINPQNIIDITVTQKTCPTSDQLTLSQQNVDYNSTYAREIHPFINKGHFKQNFRVCFKEAGDINEEKSFADIEIPMIDVETPTYMKLFVKIFSALYKIDWIAYRTYIKQCAEARSGIKSIYKKLFDFRKAVRRLCIENRYKEVIANHGYFKLLVHNENTYLYVVGETPKYYLVVEVPIEKAINELGKGPTPEEVLEKVGKQTKLRKDKLLLNYIPENIAAATELYNLE